MISDAYCIERKAVVCVKDAYSLLYKCTGSFSIREIFPAGASWDRSQARSLKKAEFGEKPLFLVSQELFDYRFS